MSLEKEHDNERQEEQREIITMFDDAGAKRLDRKLEKADEMNEPDYNPDAEKEHESEQAKQTREQNELVQLEQLREQEALQSVMQVLDMYESGIQLGAHRKFSLAQDEKAAIAVNFVPIIRKHFPDGFNIHDVMFKKYKPEVMCLIGVYMLSTQSYKMIKELKAEDKVEQQAQALRMQKARADQAAKKAKEQAAQFSHDSNTQESNEKWEHQAQWTR